MADAGILDSLGRLAARWPPRRPGAPASRPARPRDPGRRAPPRAPRGPGRRRPDDRRADRPGLGLGRPRPGRGGPGGGGACPARRPRRSRPGGRARARRPAGRRHGEGGPADRLLRARPAAAGGLARRALDGPHSPGRRRPADPPDGPPGARGAARRAPQRQERRPQGGHRLPGERLGVPRPGRRALPRRRADQRGGRDPRPQPPLGRPHAVARRSPPHGRGPGGRAAPRHRAARPRGRGPRRLRLAARPGRLVRPRRTRAAARSAAAAE